MADGVHRTYRSAALVSLGGVGFALAAVLAVWVVVDEAGRGRWLVAAAAVLWGVLIGLLILEVFLRPSVSTTPRGVVLVNPFRTVVIPWAAVRGVETELVLRVLADDGGHTSWAATGRRTRPVRSLLGPRGGQGQPAASWPAVPGRGGPPAAAQSLQALSLSGGVTPPVECMLFIEAGLNEWRVARARAAATGRPEPGAGDRAWRATEEPVLQPSPGGVRSPGDVPRGQWHGPSLVAALVPAVLLVVVTLAL